MVENRWLNSGRRVSLLAQNGLFGIDFVGVVVIVFATKKKLKSWIIFLLGLSHVLKFGTVSSNKLGKLVNNVPQLLVTWRLRQIHDLIMKTKRP